MWIDVIKTFFIALLSYLNINFDVRSIKAFWDTHQPFDWLGKLFTEDIDVLIDIYLVLIDISHLKKP